MNALLTLAAVGTEEGGIGVSVPGLIIGALLGLGIYLLGDWIAKREGSSGIRVAAIVVAIVIFFVLGFELYGG